MIKTDISEVFKGNKNKDVFGKSTVGLPAFYVSESKQISRHLVSAKGKQR